jgi:hypothetical protein
MIDKLILVGDELRFDGELVAILVDSSPFVRRFKDALEFSGENAQDGKLFDEALKVARGGLIRVTDLTAIYDKIQEKST